MFAKLYRCIVPSYHRRCGVGGRRLAADALRLESVELWSLEVGHVKISPTAIVARRVASEIQ